MADHGGQPQLVGWLTFDVSSLAVTCEPGNPPTTVIDVGVDFTVTATFTGSGTDWDNMKDDQEQCEVKFYAEGIGVGAPDFDWGAETRNLGAADEYPVDHIVVGGIAQEGIYRLGATVAFPNKHGVLGFYEGLVIQINPQAEP